MDLISHVEEIGDKEKELFRQVRVESQAGASLEDLDGFFKRLSFSMRTGRSQFIERVGNAQDSGSKRDERSSKSIGISIAVPSFMMVSNKAGRG